MQLVDARSPHCTSSCTSITSEETGVLSRTSIDGLNRYHNKPFSFHLHNQPTAKMSGIVKELKAPAFNHKTKKQAICLKKPRGDSLPYGCTDEEELMTKEFVTPDDVMRLTNISRGECLLRSKLRSYVPCCRYTPRGLMPRALCLICIRLPLWC